jgi:site-specific recombinase XerD
MPSRRFRSGLPPTPQRHDVAGCGVSAPVVQKGIGYASSQTTEAYTHLVRDDLEALQSA